MSVSTIFNENTLSALQFYALSQDKKAYLQSLPEGIEKKVLTALTLPYTADLKNKLIEAGVPQILAVEITERKHYQKIISAKSAAQIHDTLNQLKKSLSAYFDQTKPLQQNRMQSEAPIGGNESLTIKRLPSKLHVQYGEKLQKYLVTLIKEDQNNIRTFSDYAIRKLPQQLLLNLNQENKGLLLNKFALIATFSEDFVAKFYKICLETQRKTHSNFELPAQCYNLLPTSHINRLAEVIPILTNSYAFLTVWFSVNYQKKYPVLTAANSKLTISEKQSKRVVLIQALEEINKQKKITHEVMAKQIQLELLNLDLSMEDAHLDRFLKYLQTIKQPFPLFNESYKRQINQSKFQNNMVQILRNLSSASLSVQNFLQQYIIAILKNYDTSKFDEIEKKITQFIDQKRFQRLKVRVLLAKGTTLEESDKTLTENQKIQIREKRQLTICDNNKNSFKVEEEVVLKIKIKNVNKIVVKVYQLNLQKHYIEKKTQIEDNMDLHFLDPTYQFIYEVENKNPFKQEMYDMVVKQIKKERGVYVVDLDGSGISSRAVIRKGAIYCLKRITLAGLEIKFYDESGKKIEDLSIWLRGQPINIKGSYIMPFGQQQQAVSIIAVVDNYAQLFSITVPNESYRLSVSAFYNEESFIVGGKAKIILNPRLYINQAGKQGETPISLKLLKNIRINVVVEDYQYLKSTISLENVNWNYEQDYVIEIPIQTYIRVINITGTAHICKYNGKKEQLSFNQIIPIQFNDDSGQNQCFKEYYLKKVNENYVIHVLGMDGQRLSRSLTHVNIKMKWVQNVKGFDLQSNQNGQINLGPLPFAEYVIAGSRSWKIGSLQGSTQMLKKMCFKEGQLISFPLPPINYNYELGSDVNIFYMGQQTYLENMTKQIKIKDGYIQIIGLPTGKYTLSILSLNFTISIVVLKGKQWENRNQIYDEQCSTVYEFIRNSNHYLSLSDPLIEKSEGQTSRVSIKIRKPEGVQLNQNVKAHIFGMAFIPNRQNMSQISEISQSDVRYETFKLKGNTFLSNKKLSQQASYVLNRRNQKQFVGNNLQKPHILLNRVKVRDTVQTEEEMTGQTEFNKRNQVQRNRNVNLMDMDHSNVRTSSLQPNYIDLIGLPLVGEINSHNNFLMHSGLTIQNIKGDILEFNVPDYYSFVTVILVSNNSKILRNYNIQESKLKTKKISHTGLQKQQNENQAWSMSRQVYPIGKGEDKKINRTSKWCGISLLNVIQFARAQSIYLNAWVERWSSYSQQLKLDAFNKKACHELNNFIKHQDAPFFNKIVGPYIRNKINKTFVDLCLLEDKACQAWISLQYFDQLNQFEKVLLIEYLAKKDRYKQAEALATSMELLQKTNKYTYNDFKQKFETMINAEIKPAVDPMMSVPPQAPQQYQQYQQYQQAPQVYQQQMMFNNESAGGFGGINTFSASTTNTAMYAPPPPPPGSSGVFGAMQSNAVHRNPISMNSRSNARMPAPVTSTLQSYSNSMNRAAMLQTENSFIPPPELLDEAALIDQRASYVQSFKEVQKTQQFTQVTYDEVKNPAENNRNFIPQSKFWVDLALYFAKGKNNKEFSEQQFVAESIIYLTGRRSFTLAAAFFPKNLNADYQISAQDSNIVLTANKPFLLFIKQIKLVPFNPKAGLMINHRFFDPSDQYSYEEDGTAVEKEVDEFVVRKQYSLQTLVTNTTGNGLQIQLLVDLPQGSIPLGTKEYTQITSCTISPYSTQSFNRQFYFPNEGEFTMYPANVCWGKNVIAKSATIPKIIVKARRTTKKLETFMDVLAEGEDEDILKYLQTKNIFDGQIFRPQQILWMLKDKTRFEKIISILRSRGYINTQIWRFGILHDNLQAVKEFFILTKNSKPSQSEESVGNPLKVFEYYPYYSSRAHKYENQNKSKIRNVQFKQTFYRFLFQEIVYFKGLQKPSFKLAAAYYLLLQDRVDEASKLVKTLGEEDKKIHQLQFDYLESFLDMYEGFPNFTKARKICAEYTEYPVLSWRTLFNEIQSTLRNYDNAVDVEGEDKKVQYRTSVLNEGDSFKISIPAGTKVELLIYSVNLELMFSNNPFVEIKACSSVKPARIVVYEPEEQSREERFKRPEDFKDVIVEIFKSGKNTNQRKVDSILWTNPNLKSKINQKKGSLQIFYKNKPISGCYCKVYSTGSKGERFYRDGYTDITGTFKYALSQLKDITLFSILSVSDYGGIISKIAPPSQAGELNQ